MRIDQAKRLLHTFKTCPLCGEATLSAMLVQRRKCRPDPSVPDQKPYLRHYQWDIWLGPSGEENLVGPDGVSAKWWTQIFKTDRWFLECTNTSCRLEIKAVPDYRTLGSYWCEE